MQKGPKTMDETIPATPARKGELFVIDGSNVCYWHKHYRTGKEMPSVRPLLLLLCEIREHGDDFYCVFDHTIKNHMTSDREANLVEWLVRKYPKRFFRTAIDSRADPVILHFADKYGSRVISNDRYRDFFGQFAWLAKRNTPRLVQGNYHQSGLLTVEKLAYGYMELDSAAWTQDYVNRLVKCLDRSFDWQTARKTAALEESKADLSASADKGDQPARAASVSAVKASVKKGPRVSKSQKAKASVKTALPKGNKGRTQKSAKGPKPKKVKATARKASPPTSKNRPKKMASAVASKKPAKAKSVPMRRRRNPPKKNISIILSEKPAKAKSVSLRRHRNPPKKKGFLERLFGNFMF